ncbi:MAG: sigma-70 family RNA polymerase sigma factor [Planctomycetota bacterium]
MERPSLPDRTAPGLASPGPRSGAPRAKARPAATLDPLGVVLSRYLLTGDESAVETVVEATRARLLAIARRIAGEHDAEDAVQTAYLSLVRRRGAPLDAPVVPWLVTAVVRNAYRRRAATRRCPALADRLAMVPDDASDPRPAPSPDDAETLARLRGAVHRLPARYRDVVVLHDLHGLSTAQVAGLLDLSEAGVRTRLHRARALVRARVLPRAAAWLVAVPWLVADRVRDGSALSLVALGGAMNVPAAAFTAAVALAVGVFAGRSLLAPKPVPADERVERLEARARGLEDRATTLLAEREALKEQLAAAKATTLAASARERAAARPDASPAPAPAPADAGAAMGDKPATASGARILVPGHEELIAEVDWTLVGKATYEMAPLLPAFFEEWSRTGKIPTASAGRVNRLNADLVNAALAAAQRMKLAMTEANRAYTHPSMMVNAMAATLEAAGKPLTPAQAEAVRALAVEATNALLAAETGYGPETWALQKLLDETATKERFFAAAFAALTAEQRDVLTPPAAKGRLQADLFSAGLMWAAHAQAVPVTDREHLTTLMTATVADLMGWGEEKKPALRELVAPWVAELPPSVVDEPWDALSAVGMVPLTTAVEAAQRELALLDRVARGLRLDDKGMEAIRQIDRVVIPFRKPAK